VGWGAVLFFAVGMMCTLAVVAEPALGSPLDEFGCMASAACAQRCGVRCVSECCRDQSCLETTNPAQWVFPVEFGLRCYERCYDDCGHEWEVRHGNLTRPPRPLGWRASDCTEGQQADAQTATPGPSLSTRPAVGCHQLP
jgi:hypothetical protein